MKTNKRTLVIFAFVLALIIAMPAIATQVESVELNPDLHFEWTLPTSVSAGIDSAQLEMLTNDEIMFLHAPYVEIVNRVNLMFGTEIGISTLDSCELFTRYDYLRIISTISLAEFESEMMQFAEMLRVNYYIGTMIISLIESGYYQEAGNISDAIRYYNLDPAELYYQMHADGVEGFAEEISNFIQPLSQRRIITMSQVNSDWNMIMKHATTEQTQQPNGRWLFTRFMSSSVSAVSPWQFTNAGQFGASSIFDGGASLQVIHRSITAWNPNTGAWGQNLTASTIFRL